MEKMFLLDFGINYVSNNLDSNFSVLLSIFLQLCSLSLSMSKFNIDPINDKLCLIQWDQNH